MHGKWLSYRPDDEECSQRIKEAEANKASRYTIIYSDFGSSRIPDRCLKRLDVVGDLIKQRGMDGL